MRTFGPRVRPELEAKIRQAAQDLYDAVPSRKAHTGAEFAMDNEDDVVMNEIDITIDEYDRFRLNMSEESARPPFEWIMEITADMGESEYIKHYLIRDHDIVLAQRKVLTVIDDEEAAVILADLERARSVIDAA